jgi:polyhydroxyalkanoate synthesis regulator phasin
MAKKQKQESQAEQSERFHKAVQELVDAGELSPTEAEERFERAVSFLSIRAPKDPEVPE